MRELADEQELAVLRERPGAVVHDLLKLVDRTAEGGEALGYLVVGHGFGIFILKDIRLLARLDHRGRLLADLVNIFRDAADEVDLLPALLGAAEDLLAQGNLLQGRRG